MKFECKVTKVLDITKHPNADTLHIVKVMGYNCIIKQLSNGKLPIAINDYVVYIPDFSVLPTWVLKELNLWDYNKNVGMLTTKNRNRVKSIKLKGILSEGLIYPLTKINDDYVITKKHIEDDIYTDCSISVNNGEDVSEYLGIKKWEPEILKEYISLNNNKLHSHGIPTKNIIKYDIESIKKYNDILIENELVEIVEKIHGTQTRFIFTGNDIPIENTFGENKNIFITSKGIGDKEMYITNCDENRNNIYVRSFYDLYIEDRIQKSKWYKSDEAITLFGETFGDVQDLKYGHKSGQTTYRLFDVYIGTLDIGRFLNYEECIEFSNVTGIPRVPTLYIGKYNYNILKELTDGQTEYDDIDQIREGVVIRPLNERIDDRIGRVILKSVSEKYKLRKNPTEYN